MWFCCCINQVISINIAGFLIELRGIDYKKTYFMIIISCILA